MKEDTKYRHEIKHEIGYAELLALRQRLGAVAARDMHAQGGTYRIRSLYFDNTADEALREKLDGINIREKYRIRFYNGDTGFIRLEKKRKVNGLCQKQSALLTAAQVQSIVDGRCGWMAQSKEPLVRELSWAMTVRGLMPRTIVDYVREPFVFAPGNVRITLDYDIRTGLSCTDVLNSACVTVPVAGNPVILEVKWDEFLPDVMRDVLQSAGCRAGAFSKYAACRVYG